jgi:hypothetical protein
LWFGNVNSASKTIWQAGYAPLSADASKGIEQTAVIGQLGQPGFDRGAECTAQT